LRFTSKNKEAVYSGYRIYASTDINGKLELNGVLVKDTLDYIWNEQKLHIIINGNRFFLLYLPLTDFNTNKRDAIVVSARRKVKKYTPAFKVITNADIFDWYGVGPEDFKVAPRPNLDFAKILMSDIIYPENAIKNNIEGDVEIGFNVGKDGQLTDFKLLRGIGYGCDDEVIKALKKSAVWIPAIFVGRPLATQSSIVIRFKLTDQ
jgi:TonB family protein